MHDLSVLREGPLAIRKVMVEAGGGGGRSTKGKLNEKKFMHANEP